MNGRAFGAPGAPGRSPAASDRDLLFEVVLPVLGVPVRLLSDAREVIEAFEATLGYWRVLDARPDLLADERVEGRVLLRTGEEGPHRPAPVAYAMPDDRQLLVSTPGSAGLSDPRRRAFSGSVTRSLLEDREHFGSAVLESMVLAAVTWLDRQPLHASAVVRNGTALLVSGPSGRGKSTLAYAAARAGLGVLSDDVVYVQTRPLRVWGRPRSVHLPARAGRQFPELRRLTPRRLPNGKEKIAVSLAELGAAPPLPLAERAGVCILERGEGAGVAFEAIPAPEVRRALLEHLEPGFDRFREPLEDLVPLLSAGGAWRLVIGERPEEAVPILLRLLDEVDRAAEANRPRPRPRDVEPPSRRAR